MTPPSYDRLTEGQKTMGLELAKVGLTSVDYIADTVTPDAIAARLFGIEPFVPISRAAFHARIHPADWPAVEVEVEKLLDPAFDDVIELTHRTIDAQGDTRWVQSRKRLYRDDTQARGALTGVAAVIDITAERVAQERTDLLIGELRHRTGNLVSIVTTIARMVMRSGPAEGFLDRFLPRIRILASRLRIEEGTDGQSLRAAVETALEPFSPGSGALTLDGPEVALDAERAQTFAMIVHELATNSTKYGAWTRLGGTVRIAWQLDPGTGALSFSWEEAGGPPVRTPETQGFGTQVLERFAELTLRAQTTIEHDPAGLRYRLTMPTSV
jgi:two-component sensor histidine kinase